MGFTATVKMDEGTIVIAVDNQYVSMLLWQHHSDDIDVELTPPRARELANHLIKAADEVDSVWTNERKDNDSGRLTDKIGPVQ